MSERGETDILDLSGNGAGVALGPDTGDIPYPAIIFTPEDYPFNAVGDGITDDYSAFTLMIAAANLTDGVVVMLRPGATYKIDQYKTATNGINALQFIGLRGLTIEGNGAKIDFKGNFDRDASTATGIGIQITDCVGVVVRNLELDGNVEQTTNSIDAGENANANGLNIRSCDDVILENIHSHHFATDAFAIRNGGAEASPGVWRACRRVEMRNCQGRFSARNNISIIGVRSFLASNCEFTDAAQYTGTYGKGGAIGHAPKSGMDFEPTDSAFAGNQDINSGDIVFFNCRFYNNLGGDWKASLENASDTLSFILCTSETAINCTSTSSIILGIPGVHVLHCKINLLGKRLELAGGSGKATHTIFDNEIKGTDTVLYAASIAKETNVRSNRIIGTTAIPTANPLIALTVASAMFEDNSIFIPKEGYIDGGAGDTDLIANLNGAFLSSNNKWSTDLLAASGSGGTAHYYVNYGTCKALNEKFTGTAPGVADTIRPAASSAHNTTTWYTS